MEANLVNEVHNLEPGAQHLQHQEEEGALGLHHQAQALHLHGVHHLEDQQNQEVPHCQVNIVLCLLVLPAPQV
jgi:hypothetical protein